MGASRSLCLWLCARAAWGIALSAGAPKKKPHLQFTSHHKTGSVLSEGLLTCARGFSEDEPGHLPDCGMHIDEWHHWNGAIPSGCDKIVHFVRHPVDVVRSAYLYHRGDASGRPWSEPWEEQPLSETVGPQLEQLLRERGIAGIKGETTKQFLMRAPAEAGLEVVMMSIGGEAVEEMKWSWNATRKDHRVHTVCMADSWSNFGKMADRILRFIDSEETARNGDVARCFLRRDPQYLHDNDHITHNFVSSSEVDSLMKAIAVLDADKFGGRFTRGALARWCRTDSEAGGFAAGRSVAADVDVDVDPRLLADRLAA